MVIVFLGLFKGIIMIQILPIQDKGFGYDLFNMKTSNLVHRMQKH